MWVRIRDLSIEYKGKNFLRKIAKGLGRLVKIDENTMKERDAMNYEVRKLSVGS